MRLRQKSESGYVMVTVALLLVVLLGFTALAIDIGTLLSDRTQAQQAADAAALAGAFTFVLGNNNPSLYPEPDTAISHATQIALANTVMGDPITAPQVSVCVGTVQPDGTCSEDISLRRVAVTIQRQQSAFFSKIMNLGNPMVTVRGIAEAAQDSCGAKCVKPFFIPNTILANLGASSTACDACAANQVLVDTSNGSTTQFAQDRYGTQVSIHAGNPAQAIGPGQFYAIDIPIDKFPNGCPGGDCYRTAISTCLTSALVCQNFYSVKTGAMVGPTTQGVKDLIGDPPRDQYVGVGKYKAPSDPAGGPYHDTSRALVIAPIWDACSMPGFCPAAAFPNGTQVSLQIVGFAVFFIESVQGGGDVIARLINVVGCNPGTNCGTPGGITFDGSPSPYSPLPIRLVRMPG